MPRLPESERPHETASSDVTALGSDADTRFGGFFVEQDGDGTFSFNDELISRGYATPDVNITQTDSFEFGLGFSVEQCRGNVA
ncbi:hypothetical protein [Haloarchaeobius sp. TZWWS8]|uniref:hypothetical protein n=1 Tax=Haloarchaeobius sp. TZWWS8 TaxID=3446121 RepID=UPI003EBF1FE7